MLLHLCDEARLNLQLHRRLGPTTSDIMSLLGAMANDEYRGLQTLELDTIRDTRLDKLLIDIQKPENHLMSATHTTVAEKLERKWRSRFKEAYFDMDQARYFHLISSGLLRDVIFNKQAALRYNLWQPRHTEALSEMEGNLQYESGQ